MMLRVHTLGGLSVLDGERQVAGAAAQPRRLAVLALVAKAGDRGVTRDRVLSLLWPDVEEEPARNALKQAVYALRRDLGSEEVLVGGHQLRLNATEIGCDVSEFEAALATGALETAVRLYRGPFLDGFRLSGAAEFERWSDEERAELSRAYVSALERLARSAMERADAAGAVGWWRKAAARDPLNARIACALMRALVAAGDRAGALQHARIYEALLEQDLELPPDREVLELAERIRSESGIFTVAAPPPAAAPHADRLAFGAVAEAMPTRMPSPPQLSLAVLPFVGTPPDRDIEIFADGVVEEIISALSDVPDSRVAARTATAVFKGMSADLIEIGARLGVHVIVEGSVRRSGSRLRTTVRLIDVASGFSLWSERFDCEIGDEFVIQDRIALAVAERVRATISGGAWVHIAAPAGQLLPEIETPRG